jgi:hypothetical protein
MTGNNNGTHRKPQCIPNTETQHTYHTLFRTVTLLSKIRSTRTWFPTLQRLHLISHASSNATSRKTSLGIPMQFHSRFHLNF